MLPHVELSWVFFFFKLNPTTADGVQINWCHSLFYDFTPGGSGGVWRHRWGLQSLGKQFDVLGGGDGAELCLVTRQLLLWYIL